MKLYILRPSKKWEYCGGAIVAIAKDFEDLKKLCKEYPETSDEKIFNSQAEIADDSNNTWYVDSFILVEGQSRRVVYCDYNWA